MIYKIENDFLKVEINSFGAELKSLKKQKEDFEYLWSGDAKYWARKAPVLFPIVGKLKDDFYIFDNKKYEMKQHGFARDKEFTVVEQGMDYVILLLQSDEETLSLYPFSFDFYISYKLENNKLITYYKVVNRTNNEIYFSIGAHPAFNWPLSTKKKGDCFLEFDFEDKLLSYKLENGIVSDEKVEIKLVDKKLKLEKKLFSNDALIFEDLPIKTITYKNSIDEKSIKLNFEKFKYLGVWSKPTGSPFICLEPWCGIADFYDTNQKLEDKIGINRLEKNEIFEIDFTIELN